MRTTSLLLLLCAVAVLVAAPGAAGAGQIPAVAPPGQQPARAVDPPAVDQQEYRIGSGDKLRIEVYKDPQLSQSVQVRPDGKITLPLVGDIAAAGLTPTALRDHLTASLAEYMNKPSVTVIVVETLASVVYVMGEVNRPGTVSLNGPMTMLQALAMAGGFKDFAKTKHIRIIRRGSNGVETIQFNYDNAVKDGASPVFLQRGDTVIVP
jgi:polysaccharide biosynthesis/export protein